MKLVYAWVLHRFRIVLSTSFNLVCFLLESSKDSACRLARKPSASACLGLVVISPWKRWTDAICFLGPGLPGADFWAVSEGWIGWGPCGRSFAPEVATSSWNQWDMKAPWLRQRGLSSSYSMLLSLLQLGRFKNHHAFSKIFAAMNSKLVHELCTCGGMDASNAAHQAPSPAQPCLLRKLLHDALLREVPDLHGVGQLSFFFNTRSVDWIELMSSEGIKNVHVCVSTYKTIQNSASKASCALVSLLFGFHSVEAPWSEDGLRPLALKRFSVPKSCSFNSFLWLLRTPAHLGCGMGASNPVTRALRLSSKRIWKSPTRLVRRESPRRSKGSDTCDERWRRRVSGCVLARTNKPYKKFTKCIKML